MRTFLCFGLLVILCAAAAGDEPQFQSVKARDAHRSYAALVARAESDYRAKVTAAQRAYLTALNDAKRAAAGDHVEDGRIDTEIKPIKEEIANGAQAPQRPPLVVESAVLYADGFVRDQTNVMRGQVHGDTIAGIKYKGGDLKFGTHKHMILKLLSHGQSVYVTVIEDGLDDFLFGSDLGPVWKARLSTAQTR